jgi:hypothetical protein
MDSHFADMADELPAAAKQLLLLDLGAFKLIE